MSDIVLLDETFDDCSGTGGNGNAFSGTGSTSASYDNTGWADNNGNGANKCIKIGSGSNTGYLTTPSLTVTSGKSYKLAFKCAPWAEESNSVKLTITGGTINSKTTATTATMTAGEWNAQEYTIVATSTTLSVKFEKGGSNNRFFLDDVKITTSPTAAVTLTKDGFATYCSVNPMDFSETSGYTAWRVSDISAEGVVTFTKITEKIKGGQGVILYNKDADGVNTSTATIKFADGTTEFTAAENLLVGTTAPTFVNQEVGDYTNFALSAANGDFRKIKAEGMVVPANKAYLPVPTAKIPKTAARLTFVFEDGEQTTGISEE